MGKAIAYSRVSTVKQDSDNQRNAIEEYCRQNDLKVDRWITVEISSRKTPKDRKIDELFLQLCKGDTLIVSELSRLGRSLSEVIQIVEEVIRRKINLIAIKQGIKINGKPDIATKTMIFMFSMFGEIERDMISERTKMGLAAAKANGKKLGNPNLKRDNKVRQEKAVEFAESLRTVLEGFIARGMAQRVMVTELNKLGIKTRRGGRWTLSQLQKILIRLKLKTQRSKKS